MICDAINKLFPYFEGYFQKFGNLSLLEIQRHFKSFRQNPSDAFVNICIKEAARLYGKTNALLLKKALYMGNACYFANHGGFENHPQLIASTLSACSYEALEGGDKFILFLPVLQLAHIVRLFPLECCQDVLVQILNA